MMSKEITFIDLFAGCGGLSDGFCMESDMKALAHVEWESPMVDTLRNRLIKKYHLSEEQAKNSVIEFDIQKTDELINGKWSWNSFSKYGSKNSNLIIEEGLNALIKDSQVDIIIGGAPCQAYSIAGRAQDANSMKYDYRNYLFESYIKVVDYYKPKIIVFENVPGILSARPGDELIIERIYKAFDKIGYEIRKPEKMKHSIYCASDYGVAQDRNRVIIFGVRKNSEIELEMLYSLLDSLKENKKLTLRDVLGDLPKFYPLNESYKIKNQNISHEQSESINISSHTARYHNKRDIEVFKEWISKDLNKLSTKEKIEFYKKITGKDTKHIKYRSLYWDEPSPTIVAHLQKDGNMFIHPDISQARSITMREAARIQSFPDDYEFIGSNAYVYKMIGNAVPPVFANKIAKTIKIALNTKKETKIKRNFNILIACEESQRVCIEFRKLGYNAFSCDLLPCSGGHPEWHIKGDCLKVIQTKSGILQNGERMSVDKWDMMIAHPPCTFLSSSGAKWYYHPDDKDKPINERRPHPRFPNRAKDRAEAIEFFKTLANADIKYIAIENPIGIMSSHYRKADQIVQPWQFGDEASKSTCLWLKNLPKLRATKIVSKGEILTLSSGKKIPKWYSDALSNAKNADERRNLRSKTFEGIAKAIAKQYSEVLK